MPVTDHFQFHIEFFHILRQSLDPDDHLSIEFPGCNHRTYNFVILAPDSRRVFHIQRYFPVIISLRTHHLHRNAEFDFIIAYAYQGIGIAPALEINSRIPYVKSLQLLIGTARGNCQAG